MRKQIGLSVVLVLILSAMFLTTSCASKKMTQAEPAPQHEPEVGETAPDKNKAEVDLTELPQADDQLEQEAASQKAEENTLDYENVYFAFDSSALSDRARLILSNNADYLRRHANITVTVEGHCDDRGSEAYNIGLGKRRAESVKKFLVDQGISNNRLVTVSYGEKRPLALGQDETSRARNRRAQIVVNLASENRKSLKN